MELLPDELLEHILLCVAWSQDLARMSRLVCHGWRKHLTRDWFRGWHEMRKRLHAARVRTLIEDQDALNPGAPRLIYGRGTREPIKLYEAAMNEAALVLLQKNARLVSLDGARLKVGPLVNEAKIVVHAALVWHLQRDDKATVRANS